MKVAENEHPQIDTFRLPDSEDSFEFITRITKDKIIAGDWSNTLQVLDNNNKITQHSLNEYEAYRAVMVDDTLYIGCYEGYLLMMDPNTFTITKILQLSDSILSLLVLPDNSIICG
jgi:hypothetical protein